MRTKLETIFAIVNTIKLATVIVLSMLVVSILTGCATTDGLQSDGSFTYRLTPEQVSQCTNEGGCSTVTLQYERELVQQAAKHFCGVEI